MRIILVINDDKSCDDHKYKDLKTNRVFGIKYRRLISCRIKNGFEQINNWPDRIANNEPTNILQSTLMKDVPAGKQYVGSHWQVELSRGLWKPDELLFGESDIKEGNENQQATSSEFKTPFIFRQVVHMRLIQAQEDSQEFERQITCSCGYQQDAFLLFVMI